MSFTELVADVGMAARAILGSIYPSVALACEPYELPVSQGLLERLAQWSDWYNINDDYLPEAERKID